MKAQSKPATIDEYIEAIPSDVQSVLQEIRSIVQEAAPKAQERISYRMPAFFLDGALIYFAAFKNHIGIFPPVKGDEKLKAALRPYSGPKGNLKFPLDEPIPYALIRRVVKARLKEHRQAIASKRNKK